MGGIDLRGDVLVVEREPNQLDELALEFSSILDDFGIEHVYVSGYVAILTGRARATEDIDVLIEPIDAGTADALRSELAARGFWGPAMPLDNLYGMLSNGDNIWVAPDGQVAPHLEVKFVRDEFDEASLRHAITARIGGETLPIGPLELQIAYKLYLGAQKDFEDAVHLYTLFEKRLSDQRLQKWAEKLDVEEEYDRLERA
ncbi:hypothetical protein ACFQJD_04145 [Haloplanus sp. GCM10025708]|uniref:hypothetical protein n=1 Tax=Haloferacaceae TaxID=1644056 RepID=UPI003614C97A